MPSSAGNTAEIATAKSHVKARTLARAPQNFAIVETLRNEISHLTGYGVGGGACAVSVLMTKSRNQGEQNSLPCSPRCQLALKEKYLERGLSEIYEIDSDFKEFEAGYGSHGSQDNSRSA